MECGVGFKDPPIVDSTTEYVYDFIAYGCDAGPPAHNSYINRFAVGTSVANPGYGTPLSFANGGANNQTPVSPEPARLTIPITPVRALRETSTTAWMEGSTRFQ